MGMSLSNLWEFVMDREVWLAEIHGVAKSQTQLSDWTELNFSFIRGHCSVQIGSSFFQVILITVLFVK